MSSEAIVVEGLGKEYRLGANPTAYRTLRETVAEAVRRRGGDRGRVETIRALQDVSFAVSPGEAIGVIGPNGAGKTTLLKILSRITSPTEGEVRLRGRVGSLLEVGTGFHPELTGRENIFLNGAILGMRRREIERKLPQIVAFAGVAQFLDTPVKRYSSGMYVRLAFAVAAHLETEILLVDEVLSVGDFAFQRKSLGKMREQTSVEGRTVLFVSHDLASVKMLTDRCLWLDAGRVRAFGPTQEIFRDYVLSHGERLGSGFSDLSDLARGRPRKADPPVYALTFESLELSNPATGLTGTFFAGEPIDVRVRLRRREPVHAAALEVIFRVSTLEGLLLFASSSGLQDLPDQTDLYETSFTIDPNPLGPGPYTVELMAVTHSDVTGGRAQDLVRPATTFAVESNPASGERLEGERRPGLIRVSFPWDELTPADVEAARR
jgi:lipopolysaccharide transport system ATP-binding protein